MVGAFVAFGADLMLLVVALSAVGVISWGFTAVISALVFGFFGAWVRKRWRRLLSTDAEADPHETLKARYAAGELSDAEFEEKLDTLLDSDRKVDAETVDTDRSHADESDQLESRH